jgi:hypothetical protein
MSSYAARLLCAVKGPELVHTRCTVLTYVRYDAQAAAPPEVGVPLGQCWFSQVCYAPASLASFVSLPRWRYQTTRATAKKQTRRGTSNDALEVALSLLRNLHFARHGLSEDAVVRQVEDAPSKAAKAKNATSFSSCACTNKEGLWWIRENIGWDPLDLRLSVMDPGALVR